MKDKWHSSLQATYLAERVECSSSSHSFKEKPYLLTSLTTTYNADKQNSFTLAIDNLLDRQDNLSHTGSQYFSTPFNFMLPEQTFFMQCVGYLSIFGGAMLWWFFITYVVSKLRARFDVRGIRVINRIIGAAVMLGSLIGMVLIYTGVWSLH